MISARLASIKGLCCDVRRIHETLLGASGISGTAGSCLYASFLLQMTLSRFGNCQATVCGGDGAGDGGALDARGVWRGHYWVEGVDGGGFAFVADVTADQFGMDAVVVLPRDAARQWYVPGDPEIVRWAVEKLSSELSESAAAGGDARPL